MRQSWKGTFLGTPRYWPRYPLSCCATPRSAGPTGWQSSGAGRRRCLSLTWPPFGRPSTIRSRGSRLYSWGTPSYLIETPGRVPSLSPQLVGAQGRATPPPLRQPQPPPPPKPMPQSAKEAKSPRPRRRLTNSAHPSRSTSFASRATYLPMSSGSEACVGRGMRVGRLAVGSEFLHGGGLFWGGRSEGWGGARVLVDGARFGGGTGNRRSAPLPAS